jgi:hypothetical protein
MEFDKFISNKLNERDKKIRTRYDFIKSEKSISGMNLL